MLVIGVSRTSLIVGGFRSKALLALLEDLGDCFFIYYLFDISIKGNTSQKLRGLKKSMLDVFARSTLNLKSRN